MRKRTAVLLLALVIAALFGSAVAVAGPTCTPDPGPQLQMNANKCFPTPQECATGNYNGSYDGGSPGRGAICIGAGGVTIFYAGGNATVPCGDIMVANVDATGGAGTDPNTCP